MHPAFRAIFLARFISTVSLGSLGVTVLMQIQMVTHSTWQTGLPMTLIGDAMSVGLMVGGVLTGRYERKKVVLPTRSIYGIGLIGLCPNTLLPKPSLLAVYLLGLWDGSFASPDVMALLTATPTLARRENLMQAGVIAMSTMRLGSVISSMIGGLLLATSGVAWSYELAVAGTFIISSPLLNLSTLLPLPQLYERPLKSLPVGFRFLLASPLVGGTALLSGLSTMASAVRVLYPALADNWQMSAAQVGFLYATIPLGVAIDALASGKLVHNARPRLSMLLSMLGPFLIPFLIYVSEPTR